jgi:hypothetical protein
MIFVGHLPTLAVASRARIANPGMIPHDVITHL